ncbi:MAG: peptidase S10 [Alphaproteobacteria bacterium]|jgi:carboxypeptidase C (cathepsin A)|nr:peptidase S10 [Alphaproteobacteria bacterium]
MARASVAVVVLWALLLAAPAGFAEDEAAPSDLPETVTTEHVLTLADGELAYGATAGFLPVGPESDAPDADIFYVSYVVRGAEAAERPISFVFNGGPGAASVYLHLGALGPRRLVMGEDGLPAPPPARLENNPHSWLAFTDLVFIDPVGTGYSRSRRNSGGGNGGNAYWGVEKDLESLAAFIRLYLTRHDRWDSPKVIVGESYGGFRVARLADSLQSAHLIPLNGAIMVSPALEFALQHRARFTLLPWIVTFPAMAASAETHGRGGLGAPDSVDVGPEALAQAEEFARGAMLRGLALGDALAEAERQALYADMAGFLGLSPADIADNRGRISPGDFSKLLLEDEGRLVGRYDGSVSGFDPYPGRPGFAGGDPSFDFLLTAFADAIVPYLGESLGFETDRAYESLSRQVNRNWEWSDGERDSPFETLGSIDALYYGMVINPTLQVVIAHGLFDLITPYFASHYLVDTMGLPPALQENLQLFDYYGGHMFYSHDDSLAAFTEDLRAVYQGMGVRP